MIDHAEPRAPLRHRAMGLPLSVTALLVAMFAAWVWWQSQPASLPDAGAMRLPCVSYAPFRRAGHTPFDASLLVTPAQIEEDLRLLATVTDCVRTYGLDHGLEAVPAIAGRLGMQVLLGAWIGRDDVANAAQLERALALVRAHPGTVKLLIVGNEVLLRREQTPQALATWLQRARAASSVPVAYADVWEFWLRHRAALQPHVDVAAVHILPFWEDEPVHAREAVAHVREVAARVRDTLAPTPVFVAETGWPAAGRQRGPAVPGVVPQARFVRAMSAVVAPPGSLGLPTFNLIEGFDQPWKRALEGAMGGYWGVFDAQGRSRVSLSEARIVDPSLRGVLVAGAWGALAAALWLALAKPLGALGRRRERRGVAGAALVVLAGVGIGMLVQWQRLLLELWSRHAWEATVDASLSLIAFACAIVALAQAVKRGRPMHERQGIAHAWHNGGLAERVHGVLVVATLFACAALALQLVFDARYRPLQWPAFTAAGVALLLAAWLGDRWSRRARQERLLAAIAAVAGALVVVNEGLDNAQAWGFAVTSWLPALALALPVRGHRAPPSTPDHRSPGGGPSAGVSSAPVSQGSAAKAASNTAGAA
jgi:exo-beta-1,3-glucanase (GH17 family)